MSEVDEKEINRGIADYCGFETDGEVMGNAICVVRNRDGEPNYITAYTRSLDALVPVWEKLGGMDKPEMENSFCMTKEGRWEFLYGVMSFQVGAIKDTLQLAAAISTYKAIKALEGRGK